MNPWLRLVVDASVAPFNAGVRQIIRGYRQMAAEFKKLQAIMKTGGNGISQVFKAIGRFARDAVAGMKVAFTNGMKAILRGTLNAFSKMNAGIRAKMAATVSSVRASLARMKILFIRDMGNIVNVVQMAFLRIQARINPIFTKIMAGMRATMARMGAGLGALKNPWQLMGNVLQSAGNIAVAIASKLTTMAPMIATALSSAISKSISMAMSSLARLGTAFTSISPNRIFGGLLQGIGQLTVAIASAMTKSASFMISKLGGAATAIGGVMSRVGARIAYVFRNANVIAANSMIALRNVTFRFAAGAVAAFNAVRRAAVAMGVTIRTAFGGGFAWVTAAFLRFRAPMITGLSLLGRSFLRVGILIRGVGTAIRGVTVHTMRFFRHLRTNVLAVSMVGGILASPAIAAERMNRAMQKAIVTIPQALTAEQIKDLRNNAIETARTVNFSPVDIAGGYEALGRSGRSPEDMKAQMPIIAKFAQASGGTMDLNEASTLLMRTLGALNLQTEDSAKNLQNLEMVAGMLAATDLRSVATVQELSEALQNNFSGSIRTLNLDLAEQIGLLGVFADAGKTGLDAGTAATIVYRDLADSFKKFGDQWERLGVDVFDEATGNVRSMVDILKDLEKAMAGKTPSQRFDMFSKGGLGLPKRSKHFTELILGKSGELAAATEAARNWKGQLDYLAENSLTPFQRSVNNLRASFQKFADAMQPVVDWMTGVLNGIADMIGSKTGLDFAAGLSKTVIRVFNAIGDGFQMAIRWFLDLLMELSNMLDSFRKSAVARTLGMGYNTTTYTPPMEYNESMGDWYQSGPSTEIIDDPAALAAASRGRKLQELSTKWSQKDWFSNWMEKMGFNAVMTQQGGKPAAPTAAEVPTIPTSWKDQILGYMGQSPLAVNARQIIGQEGTQAPFMPVDYAPQQKAITEAFDLLKRKNEEFPSPGGMPWKMGVGGEMEKAVSVIRGLLGHDAMLKYGYKGPGTDPTDKRSQISLKNLSAMRQEAVEKFAQIYPSQGKQHKDWLGANMIKSMLGMLPAGLKLWWKQAQGMGQAQFDAMKQTPYKPPSLAVAGSVEGYKQRVEAIGGEGKIFTSMDKSLKDINKNTKPRKYAPAKNWWEKQMEQEIG